MANVDQASTVTPVTSTPQADWRFAESPKALRLGTEVGWWSCLQWFVDQWQRGCSDDQWTRSQHAQKHCDALDRRQRTLPSGECWKIGNSFCRRVRRSSCCGCFQACQRRRSAFAARIDSDGSSFSYEAHMSRSPSFNELLYRDITPEDYELLLNLDESLQRRTADVHTVDALPRAHPKDAAGKVCAVCLDSFRRDDLITLLPPCKHIFHKECISKWLLERHRTCPLCNVDVFGSTN